MLDPPMPDEVFGKKLAVDLRDLAARDGDPAGFAKRFEALRKRQLRCRGFLDRWKRVGDGARASSESE